MIRITSSGTVRHHGVYYRLRSPYRPSLLVTVRWRSVGVVSEGLSAIWSAIDRIHRRCTNGLRAVSLLMECVIIMSASR